MLTISAIMAVFVSVSVPAAAHIGQSSGDISSTASATSASAGIQQASGVSSADASAPVPAQSFASSADAEVSAAKRDAIKVKKLVVEPVAPVYSGPSGSFAGSYAGEFAGFLAMWPASAPVNDGFGYRDGGEFHGGIDLMTGSGATIVSASPGVVTEVSFGGGWGQHVKIDHGSGVSTLYSHMIAGSQTVSPGQTVAAGTPIGLSGSTGYVTVAHLHFETYVNGSRVDPMGLLP